MKSETPLMRMQKHFNGMVDAYNEMPEINDVIKKAILEDAITTIAAVMDGITHEYIDFMKRKE
tara:strand:- start:207 stop:395 length:189 start_codon:yes stop_codon:yes gene_type:complete